MAHKAIKLSKAEKLLTEWAHNDHASAKQQVEQTLQLRLQSIAESHDVPENCQVQFLKHPDGSMTLEFETPDEQEVQEAKSEGEVVGKIGSDGEVHDNGEGDEA